MPRSGSTFMTVDTYCQITFICTGMIHKLHKLNTFRTELIITPPHPTSTCSSFSLLLSQWLAWPDAQAPSSLSPVLLPTYSIHHQSLAFTLKELSYTPVHFVPSHCYNSSSSHHHFLQGLEQQSLNSSPWTQTFCCPQGAYLQNKYLNEKHLASLKTQAVEYLTVAKRVNL